MQDKNIAFVQVGRAFNWTVADEYVTDWDMHSSYPFGIV